MSNKQNAKLTYNKFTVQKIQLYCNSVTTSTHAYTCKAVAIVPKNVQK